MFPYLDGIWNCRYFWLSLVKMDLRSRYRGSALGIGWSLLHPIAMTAILCVVFRYAFNQDLRTYAPLVFTGMTFWGFFSAAVVQGCGCFFQGESYIRQFPAPLAIYPIRTVLGSGFHFCIGLLLAIVLAVVMGPDTSIAFWSTRTTQLLTLPSLIPTLVLLLLLGWSLAVLAGLLNVRFRDTRHLTEIGLQGLFYMTPIMYPMEIFRGRFLGRILEFNPLVPFLDLLRQPILYGQLPRPESYALAGLIVLLTTTLAMVALMVEERRLIFYL